jgi:hypothetical protein
MNFIFSNLQLFINKIITNWLKRILLFIVYIIIDTSILFKTIVTTTDIVKQNIYDSFEDI